MAELGLFSLILALWFSGLTILIPTIKLWKKIPDAVLSAKTYAFGTFSFISLAYLCLTYCFLTSDFSVSYVLANSSLDLPLFYKLCAVWGGHEGSMLLWVLILNLWTIGVCIFSKSLEKDFLCRVIIVLAALSLGFILFLLMTSNPFERQFHELATQGRDLNPLLQDPGFLFHPPMLYMGYVGFSVAFAFAIAALWMGRFEATWAKWTRPWTLIAWCCLTAGITLGSWWAYRELGWGGWWFWDPVENASFMPWLVGTALIHSLMVSEKRQFFLAWTLLLAIIAFSLSLIGTFLVRSGVLTSVHAFAVDPKRGIFILDFLFVVIGTSLLMFALRAPKLKRVVLTSLISKETVLLLNNIFLIVAMLTVLMGTLYPLLIDGLGLGKLSVGAPYFNTVFVPLAIPVLILMGLGLNLDWQRSKILPFKSILTLIKGFSPLIILSILLPFVSLICLTSQIDYATYLGLILATWIILTSFKFVIKRGLNSMTLSSSGMLFAHLGIATTVIGISVSTGYGIQDDVRLSPGQEIKFSGYELRFEKEEPLTGPNYSGTRASFELSNPKHHKRIYPEKRFYQVAKMAMTDSAIDVTAFRDIYLALGEGLDDGSWIVRLYYKPFVRWIWAGGFMILVGGFLSFVGTHYRRFRFKASGVQLCK